MRNLLLAAMLTIPLAAPADEGAATSHTLQHGGRAREYLLRLPRGWNKEKRWPLALVLHGGGGTARGFERARPLGAAADRLGYVLAYPQGLEKAWRDGREPHLQGKTPGIDDVAFLSALIDELVRARAVDARRVYATGISNGGFMSFRLACDLAGKIAAVAPVTATLSVALKEQKPAQPISVMILNGTADPLVPYGGGHVRLFRFGKSRGEILSTDQTVRFFVRHNGCREEAQTRELPDRRPDDGTRVTVLTHGGGKQGSEVVLYRITGGGHTWPGGSQYLPERLVGRVCRDFDAGEAILEFFGRHTLPDQK